MVRGCSLCFCVHDLKKITGDDDNYNNASGDTKGNGCIDNISNAAGMHLIGGRPFFTHDILHIVSSVTSHKPGITMSVFQAPIKNQASNTALGWGVTRPALCSTW